MGAADYKVSEYLLQVRCTSIGASPSAAFVAVPWDGVLDETTVTPQGVITTTDSTITVSICPGGVAASAVAVGGTIVVPFTGAAAGTFHRAKHSGARKVRAGDTIRVLAAGGAGTSVNAQFNFKIRR